jgi:hypothetical protein
MEKDPLVALSAFQRGESTVELPLAQKGVATACQLPLAWEVFVAVQ